MTYKLQAIATDTKARFLVDPLIASGGSYEQTFTQASLSIANILPVTHNLNTYPSAIALYDSTGESVSPDSITYSNANAIAVDLSSFAPITGTWKISIGA